MFYAADFADWALRTAAQEIPGYPSPRYADLEAAADFLCRQSEAALLATTPACAGRRLGSTDPWKGERPAVWILVLHCGCEQTAGNKMEYGVPEVPVLIVLSTSTVLRAL